METAERVGVRRAHGQLPVNLASEAAEVGSDEVQHGFDILANVVWSEISRTIMDDLGSVVFAAGKPIEFRKVRVSKSEPSVRVLNSCHAEFRDNPIFHTIA